MALSKWFLCGAEGAFDKDESLAFTFAEKAARRGLPSAEFAMGYYKEVGVGGEKDIQESMKWYSIAAEHGNTDAVERIAALNQVVPQALSRQEHDTITEAQLVRKRTQARERSSVQPRMSAEDGRQVVEMARKSSIVRQQSPPRAPANMISLVESSLPSAVPQQLPPQQQQQQQQQQPQRQFAGQHRYTLVDPGSGGAPPSRQQSPIQQPQPQPAYARAAGRPPGQRQGSGPPQGQSPQALATSGDRTPTPQGSTRPPGPKPPTTFAEMGIQGAKLEEKECVIM
jgi:hypothetical protein